MLGVIFKLIPDGANREPVVTVVVVREDVVTEEVQAVGEVVDVRCRRPVVSVVTCIEERTIVVVACSRKEQRNAVCFTSDETTSLGATEIRPTGYPRGSGIGTVNESLELIISGDAPSIVCLISRIMIR